MKTSNLAIVFTDIKGFTARTSQQTHEENERMLRVHDALLTPVFKAFGGRPVKTIGDAFLVVFESPTQAVLCGVAIQDRLWDYNRRVPEAEQIHVRVAINMGEVRVEKGDVFGEPVNIAARVEGLADAGEVLFTEAVYLSMNKAEVPAEDRGSHELKGIPEKIRVYRVPAGGYRLSAEPASSPAAPVSGPPYGGLALARISNLAEPDPVQLAASGEIMGHLGAAATGLAGRALRRARTARSGFDTLPRRLRLGLGVGAVMLLVLCAGWAFFGGDPVERALSSGDLALARQEIKKLKAGPRRTFLEGRLAEERKEFEPAAHHFEDAARAGESRGYRRLVRLTSDPACQARASAARALARLGDRSAVSALKDLQDSKFPDEASDDVLGTLFGCRSRRAAQEAIQALEARND